MITLLKVLIYLILFFLVKDLIKKNRKIKPNSPSGPFAFPILGNLVHLLIFKILKVQEHNIIEKYNPSYNGMVRMWCGNKLFIFASDYQVVRCFQKDENYMDRPTFIIPTWGHISNYGSGIMLANGEIWQRAKTTLFKSLKLHCTKDLLEEKSTKFVNLLEKFSNSNKIFYPRRYSRGYTGSILFKYMFNQDYEIEDEFLNTIGNAILQVFHKNSHLTAFDFLEFLSPIRDIFIGFRLKCFNVIRNAINENIKNHLKNLNGAEKSNDIMDDLINEYNLKEECSKDKEIQIHQICFDSMNTDIVTVATTIDWVLIQLCNHQDLQDVVYNEIKESIKNDSTQCSYIKVCHKQYLPFLIAFIKETMRVSALGWSLPKTSKNDQICGDYFIPKDAVLIINYYALHKKETFFKDPSKFNPNRYLDKSIPIPDIHFGVGPRACPGRFVAMDQVFLAIANILLKYKVKSVDGKKIDDTIQFSIYLQPKDFGILLENRN